ncbi:hypothetical protein COLU111180_07010 [Cohnella lubricantis]|uniref:AMP-dependent synthetase and ligase n=1 Tax=Cohnella lubricantis TaxID=2163172 RepID=A0A841TH80_9BACL|nr:hypothetical protein [Cohnella lubricantis]MBB6678600.1 hypothetical protein [Cohnella lubricantis]MBP2119242.1 DNA repair ATPase RecN [Cohnella lubricantis]
MYQQNISNQIHQIEQMCQQMMSQTQQASANYQQMLQQEQQNAVRLEELAQREHKASQMIQTALHGHQTAIQQLQQMQQIARQIEQSIHSLQSIQSTTIAQSGWQQANQHQPSGSYGFNQQQMPVSQSSSFGGSSQWRSFQ